MKDHPHHINDDFAIPPKVQSAWQTTVDLIADIMQVPSAIITRVFPPYVEVFTASATPDNPYHAGQSVELAKHYCEEVVAQKRQFFLSNARKSPQWNRAPELKYNMVSYLGYPLAWPNGEIFGTICVLDSKENHYSKTYQGLIQQFQNIVQLQLRTIYESQVLKQTIANRDTFFSIISHDLKSPFLSLNGYLELLETDLEHLSVDEIRDMIKRMKRTYSRIHGLLDNLLKWACMQSDKIEPFITRVKINDIVLYVLEMVSAHLENKRITIDLKIRDDIFVNADQNMINSVIMNIIGNAIKFTPEYGRIAITEQIIDDQLQIAVTDTGVGMDEENLFRCFVWKPHLHRRVQKAKRGAALG